MFRLTLAALLVVVVLVRAAPVAVAQAEQGGTGTGTKKLSPVPGENDPKAKGDMQPLSLDKLKLPPDLVVVVVSQLRQAQELFPDLVVLKTAKFQEMLKRIDELEKKLQKVETRPNSCQLAGTIIKSEFVLFKAEFLLVADKSNCPVVLGLQGAYLEGIEKMDGQAPYLKPGADGYVIVLPRAGNYTLNLRILVKLVSRKQDMLTGGTQESFTLGLPGAAITRLTLELPKAITEVQWNGHTETDSELIENKRVWTLTPSLAREVKVSWVRPPSQKPAAPLAAQWKVAVQLQEGQVVTTARLLLEDVREQTTQWRLLVPKGAQVDIPGEAGLAYRKEIDNATGVVTLKGPPARQLEVVVKVSQRRPVSQLAIGPFLVLGAERQQGEFDVKATREALVGQLLRFHPHGDLRQQDVPEESSARDLVARFKSWDLTHGVAPALLVSGKGLARIPPPLEVELKSKPASVETAVDHTLRPQIVDEGSKIDVVSKIHVTPLQGGVDFLDVQLPQLPEEGKAWWLTTGGSQASFPGNVLEAVVVLNQDFLWPVRSPTPGDYQPVLEGTTTTAELRLVAGQNKARIQLTHTQFQKFTVVLRGTYTLLAANVNQVRLDLPRPVSLVDRGGTATVELKDDLELVLPGKTAAAPTKHRGTRNWERAPAFVVFGWKLYQPEIPITILTDLTVEARHGTVRQQLTVDFAAAGLGPKDVSPALRSLVLRVPPQVLHLEVVSGGSPVLWQGGRAVIGLQKSKPLVLQYAFSLEGTPAAPGNGREGQRALFQVPVHLIWPEGYDRIQTRVRIWSKPGSVPEIPVDLPGNKWWEDVAAREPVPDKDSYPAWVLRTTQPGALLTLLLENRSLFAPKHATPLVDRVLVHIVVEKDGTCSCHVRYRLTQVYGQYLDVVFPVPVRSLKPAIELGGLPAVWDVANAANTARVQMVPRTGDDAVLLSVRYKLPPGSGQDWRWWQTVLTPPHFTEDVSPLHRVRWQVQFPPLQVPLFVDSAGFTCQRWTWRYGLFTPEARDTEAELETWIAGKGNSKDDTSDGLEVETESLDPVQIVVLPFPVWFLACSGLVLALGLGVQFSSALRPVLWVFTGLVTLGLIAVGIRWPSVLFAVLYGMQPGMAVLLLLLGLQWLLHRRYQRKMIFLPGFTRIKPTSSLLQPIKAPSTVDVKPSSNSGSQRAGKEGGS